MMSISINIFLKMQDVEDLGAVNGFSGQIASKWGETLPLIRREFRCHCQPDMIQFCPLETSLLLMACLE